MVCAQAVHKSSLMSFTKKDADVIITKLRAKHCRSRNHKLYVVTHEGKKVGRISVRHSSHGVGQDYLPQGLCITRHQVKQIIACHMDRDGYLAVLEKDGNLRT